MAMASKNETHHSYGVELPSFTFDYSEYFVSATIARQRYLNMVLIGHRIIYEDYPIEAISTEYENMEHWNQATKFWSKPVKYSVRSKLQQMVCVIQYRHNGSTTPFQVPATWLRISSKALNETGMHSNYNRHIEMLRCPLNNFPKQNGNFYINVDVYRKGSGPQNTKSLLLSFAVSSQKSYVGYPNVPNFQVGSILPLTEANVPSDSAISVSQISSNRQSVTLIACIPGVRIAHIKRSETGLSMLLEFLAHLFHHGIDQVIVGIVAPVTSSFFITAQALIQILFPRNFVLLIPTSVPNYEDVPGLPGLQFSDNFSDVFFLNHCLYLLKVKDHTPTASGNIGPKYMLVMRVNQLLLSVKKSETLKNLLTASLEQRWTHEFRGSPTVTGMFLGGASHYGSSSANHQKGKSSSEKGNKFRHKEEAKSPKSDSQVRRLMEDSFVRPSLNRLCSIRIQSSVNNLDELSSNAQYHFVSDPLTVFHDNGPGHFTYMKDFFKDSVPRTLKPSVQALFPWMVTLINIDKAIAIDVHSTKDLLQQYSGSSGSSSSSNKNGAVHSDIPASHAIVYPVCVSSSASSSSSLPSVVEHGILNASVLQVNTYVSPLFPSDTLQDLPSQGAGASNPIVSLEFVQELTKDIYEKIQGELTAACDRVAAVVATDSEIGNGKNRIVLKPPACRDSMFVKQVWTQVQEQLHKQQEQQQEKPNSPLSEHLDTSPTVHKSRKDIRPPFWQLCNTAHLSEILRKVFFFSV
jgi:hypothetical protein